MTFKSWVMGIFTVFLLGLTIFFGSGMIDNTTGAGFVIIEPTIIGGMAVVEYPDGTNISMENILEGSGWFNLAFETTVPDNYSFGACFNSTDINLTALRVRKPHNISISKNYTCEGNFSYTINPNYFWCYSSNNTGTLMEHSFESGNIASKTAFWTETKEVEFKNVNGDFGKLNIDYNNKDTCFYIQNVEVFDKISGQVKIKMPRLDYGEEQWWDPKTDFIAIKSSYGGNFVQARNDGKFWIVDPWTKGTTGIEAFFSLDNASISSPGSNPSDLHNGYNVTNVGATVNQSGWIVDSFLSQASDYMTVEVPINPSAWSMQVWINPDNIANTHILAGWYQSGAHELIIDFSQAYSGNIRPYYDGVWIDDEFPAQNWSTGSWQLLSLTYESGNITFYRNGKELWSKTGKSDLPSPTVDMKLLTRGDYTTIQNFLGNVDHWGFWDLKLTGDEILEWNNSFLSYPFSAGVLTLQIDNTTLIYDSKTYGEGDCSTWQTSYSNVCNSTEGRPLISFKTIDNVDANFSIKLSAHNYSPAFNCSEISHTFFCQPNFAERLVYDLQSVYIVGNGSEGKNVSFSVKINMTAGSPGNGTGGNGTELISCISAVGEGCGVAIADNCAVIS